MKHGHVIFLNGTSSSGKTTIARALQERLDQPYMLVSIDGFFDMYPGRFLEPSSEAGSMILARLVPAVVSGLHGCVAALVRADNNVLVDHVLQEEGWLKECVRAWAGLAVLFVGVRCPLEVVEQREQARKDRNIGTARYQYEHVHAHGIYDLEVDTSVLDVEECVRRIIDRSQTSPAGDAFQKLAKRFECNGEPA